MKITIFLLALTLLGCSLHAPKGGAATEQLEHHGETVALSDNPEVCIACHDDKTGKDHHPIAMAYPPPGKEDFMPAAALKGNGLHLFNQQVACTSCHNLEIPGKNHLVAGNDKSRLCLFCHRK